MSTSGWSIIAESKSMKYSDHNIINNSGRLSLPFKNLNQAMKRNLLRENWDLWYLLYKIIVSLSNLHSFPLYLLLYLYLKCCCFVDGILLWLVLAAENGNYKYIKWSLSNFFPFSLVSVPLHKLEQHLISIIMIFSTREWELKGLGTDYWRNS